MKCITGFICIGVMMINVAAADTIDLSGKWRVQLERDAKQESWQDDAASQAVRLPGSLAGNNIGAEISLDTPWMGFTGRGGWKTGAKYAPYRQPGNIKVPFWLQPVKYYKGKAWYRREVRIPKKWAGKRIILNLERCHWLTRVWVDGRPVPGFRDSLCTPHRYELSEPLSPGKHTLTVLVDNNYHIRVGPDAHSVTDHTQGNWNGIVGDISLTATDTVWLDNVQVFPDVGKKQVMVKATIGNATGGEVSGKVGVKVKPLRNDRSNPTAQTYRTDQSDVIVEITVDLGENMLLWDEFNPNLYTATVSLDNGESRKVTFGMREICVDGRKFLVNGRQTIMRGNLDCAAFPKTGHPPMDVKEWRRIFKTYKAHGLNHARFHSWCPPEAAFKAADIEGIYLQPECATWRGTCGYKNARPVEPFLYDESDRIFREYGNYASFALYAHGNEPWEINQRWLNDTWTKDMKAKDGRHLVAAGAHYPLGSENDFHLPGCSGGFKFRYHQQFNARPPSTLRNYESQIAKKSAPCISHECGQWCVYPNLREIKKYKGVMRARNMEIVRDFMEQNQMLDQADEFLNASGRFQTILYKESIESFLRTRDVGGYQLLSLNDFPGQGTALVGVLDAFYEEKGYVTPEEFRSFSGPVVPLLEMEKRVWLNSETFKATVRIAQFGETPLLGIEPVWQIKDDDGTVVGKGHLAKQDIAVGNDQTLGVIEYALAKCRKAMQLSVEVFLPDTEYINRWNIWVYSDQTTVKPESVIICRELGETLALLKAGKSVLLAPGPDAFIGNTFGRFEAIFWNKAWFPGQKEHTLGLLIQSQHPALAAFPTDSHADFQWWDLMMNYKPIIMDGLPPKLRAVVQPIDDWNTCRRLGMLFEARVGEGRLMVTSVDIDKNMAERPVARQFLASVLSYMNSSEFDPAHAIAAEQLKQLIPFNALKEIKAVATASSAETGHEAALVMDGRPGSIWHSVWSGTAPGYPHHLDISFPKPVNASGVRLLPRQDGNANGMVKDVEIYISNNKEWGDPVARVSLNSNQEWKQIDFGKTVPAAAIRIKALTPQNQAHPWASFAEVEVIIEKADSSASIIVSSYPSR